MNNKISRKYFIKNCTLSLGLMPLGLSALNAANNDRHFKDDKLLAGKRRGSWLRKGTQQTGDITLAKVGKGCSIVVGNNENTAVQQAAKFLSKDIAAISGHTPTIVDKADENTISIRLVTIGNAEIPASINTKDLIGKWEAYKIITTSDTVWLIGSDFRGTAYATYTLSERLGIDPLYLWTNYQPEFQETLVMKETEYSAASPAIKYRGFFHDDEDILPRPFESDGTPYRFGNVPLDWYQRYFETALRLRMNMVAPYTRVHRRYEVQKCASDWGLFYTSHHYDILLSNPFGIERFHLAEKRGVDTEWDWFKNKENMIKYWRGGVEENKELQTIFPVGLRGTDDHAYEFPKNTPADVQAKVFREAMDAQVKTVENILPANQKGIYHFTLYTEMLDKYQNNRSAFNVPEEAIIVWPDDNDGIMRNLPKEMGKWKHGVYYHLAYFGGDNTKQSVHTVSPQKIAAQFSNIIKSGATEFMLANVSEMREFIMEARMLSEICWDGEAVLKGNDAAGDYIKWWSGEYFDDAISKDVADIYRQYYGLLSTPLMSCFGATVLEDGLDKISKKRTGKKYDKVDEKKEASLKSRDEKYQLLFNLIGKVTLRMTSDQRQFFYENVGLGLLMDWRPTQAAIVLLQSLQQNDEAKSWSLVEEARKPLEELETEISRAERPPFENWYRETWIRPRNSKYNVHRSYVQLREFISLKGMQTPVKPREKVGHRIEEHKLWNTFLEDLEKVKND